MEASEMSEQENQENQVKDGPACRVCGLPNYQGVCPHCRGDEDESRRELGEWSVR